MDIRNLFGSLRARLMVVVVLAVLPGFAIGLLNAVSMLKQTQKATKVALHNTLDQVTRSVGKLVGHTMADLSAAGRGMSGYQTTCPASIVAFARQHAKYLDVGLMEGDGRVVCDLARPGVVATPVDHALLQLVLRRPGRPISALVPVKGERLPRLVMFRVFPVAGAASLVAYVSTDLASLLDFTADPIVEKAQVFIFDMRGQATELNPAEGQGRGPLPLGELSKQGVLRRLMPAKGPFITHHGSDLIALVPLGAPGKLDGVMLRVPRSILYRVAWQELERSIILLLSALLLILILVWWMSDRLIMQPAQALMRSADRLAYGDLSTRTGLLPGKDEFSRVATAFDRMAGQIQQRTLDNTLHLQTLKRVNQLQMVLASINAAIFRRESMMELLDEICTSMCEAGGIEHAWIGEVVSGTQVIRPIRWAGQQSAVLANRLLSLNEDIDAGRGPTATVAQTGKMSVNNRFLEEAPTVAWRDMAEEIGIGSALALPMGVAPDGQRRILTLYALEADYFSVEEVRIIEQVAHDAAFGLHLIATEAALAHTSSHDPITGLPNHILLRQGLADAIRHARSTQKKVVISVLEIGFQQVVSQWGTQQGHDLFKRVGQELEASLLEMEMVGVLTGARLALVMSDVDNLDAAEQRIAFLLGRLRAQAMYVDEVPIASTIHVGVAVFPGDSDDPEELVDKALGALTLAGQDGGESVQFFSTEISAALHANRELAQQLHGAIGRGELVLHYQPIVSLATGSLHGFEALLRWIHPTAGEISPTRFIPLAEGSGLISVIGEWVIEQAARQAMAWADVGTAELTITVNVSAVQLRDVRFAERIKMMYERLGFEPRHVRLAMEVTESQLIVDVDRSIKLLKELRALGIAIVIDDFGTGYSSLSYLHRLPLDALKIDKSFTQNIDTSAQDQKLVAGILALAKSLDLETVSEGIEREGQLQMTKRMGCTYGQGFLYDRALPAGEAQRKWLEGSGFAPPG